MAKTPRCTPKRHRQLVRRRKAEARYVRKHPGAAAKASAKYYAKHRRKIASRRKKLRSKQHRAQVAAARKKYGGSRGRPRTC